MLVLCVHGPKISTAVLIVQATTCAGCSSLVLRVHRPKNSTAGGKNSISALAMLAAFCISVLMEAQLSNLAVALLVLMQP